MEISPKRGAWQFPIFRPESWKSFCVFAKICAGTVFVILRLKLCLNGNWLEVMYTMENISQERPVLSFEEYLGVIAYQERSACFLPEEVNVRSRTLHLLPGLPYQPGRQVIP